MSSPRFFTSPAAFRKWLAANHAKHDEVWVGFHRISTGKPSLTWPQSVDEALCVGWIDGIRKSIDETCYCIRFTPRRKGSIWSAVNIARVKVLTEEGRMLAAGLEAYAARSSNKSAIYSYENRPMDLPKAQAAVLRRNKVAWKFFEAQAPSYKRAATWWVVSAKKEETKARRLAKLIEDSAAGKRLAQFTWKAAT